MLVTVEGNIGAGKTTLINELTRILGATLLPEPVQAKTFATLLERYYEDPKRWGMTFQLDTIRARAVAHRLAPNGLVLQDRSIIGDALFAQVAHSQGFIDETEYQVYLSLRDALTATLPPPAAIIYLQASPETCRERITMRARGCEAGVPLDYLTALHEAHEEMAEREKENCLVVPWETFGSAEEVAARLCERLEHKLRLDSPEVETLQGLPVARRRAAPMTIGTPREASA